MSDLLVNDHRTSSIEPEATANFNRGSFRDPGGRVFERGARIFRTVGHSLTGDFGWVMDSGLLDYLVATGQCVRTWEAQPADLAAGSSAWKVLESERIPYISYPYEWPFAALKRAALFHLDLHLDVLARGGTLIDASAYNVQFRGPQPVFIDTLSFRRYREGEIWAGHRQFCEQFLNPLLLRALFGVPHNAWYRGAMEGIPTQELAALLKLRHKLSWNVLTHVVLPDVLQQMASSGRVRERTTFTNRNLPKRALEGILGGLRRFITRLEPANPRRSPWTRYAQENTYSSAEMEQKRCSVREFVESTGSARVLDLGCNTGDYAEAALAGGARYVIGIETDPATADLAFARALTGNLNFLPLVIDGANPSPSQGWNAAERPGFTERAAFDAVIALAFEHHLAIGRNIPLDQLVPWLVGLAPRGVIEFVPKEDPTIQWMLALREDIFHEYLEANFVAVLGRFARLTRQERMSSTGRMLFWFDRS